MESLTRIFLVRAPAVVARAGELERRIDGTIDSAADPDSLRRMQHLLESLARRRPAAIVSSPSERCLSAQRALADRTTAALRIDPRLSPRYLGVWQGQTPSGLGAAWGSFLANRANAADDAESLNKLEARALAALDDLAAEFAGLEVVVITHADAIRAALARALPQAPQGAFALEPGQAAALDWAHPAAREFQHAVIGVGFDWDLPPVSKQPQRFPGGASVLPRR